MNDSRRRRGSRLVLMPLLLLPVLAGCQMPSTGGTAPTSSTTSAGEAEKTRKIEEKAAEIQRREEEIRNMQGTEQEKIDAVNALEKERQELIRMQESGSGS